jgi:conjugal transfer pilus assembly protein TraA
MKQNPPNHPSQNLLRSFVEIFAVVLIAMMVANTAWAAGAGGGGNDGNTEFGQIYQTIRGWVGGYLGKLLALFAFLVGLFFGAIKQNFIMALGGVGIAIMIAVMPGLMENLIGGTI